VYLIGDAAPNTISEVEAKRAKKGEVYWINKGFLKTDINKELIKFKRKKCPVHSFYLNDGEGFNMISTETGGICNKFDSMSYVIDFVVKDILMGI
jgi:hypothetical protein